VTAIHPVEFVIFQGIYISPMFIFTIHWGKLKINFQGLSKAVQQKYFSASSLTFATLSIRRMHTF
jgi:hypothetical protein